MHALQDALMHTYQLHPRNRAHHLKLTAFHQHPRKFRNPAPEKQTQATTSDKISNSTTKLALHTHLRPHPNAAHSTCTTSVRHTNGKNPTKKRPHRTARNTAQPQLETHYSYTPTHGASRCTNRLSTASQHGSQILASTNPPKLEKLQHGANLEFIHYKAYWPKNHGFQHINACSLNAIHHPGTTDPRVRGTDLQTSAIFEPRINDPKPVVFTNCTTDNVRFQFKTFALTHTTPGTHLWILKSTCTYPTG